MYSNFNALMHNVQKWSDKLWRCAFLIVYVYFDIIPLHSIDLFLYSLKISKEIVAWNGLSKLKRIIIINFYYL